MLETLIGSSTPSPRLVRRIVVTVVLTSMLSLTACGSSDNRPPGIAAESPTEVNTSSQQSTESDEPPPATATEAGADARSRSDSSPEAGVDDAPATETATEAELREATAAPTEESAPQAEATATSTATPPPAPTATITHTAVAAVTTTEQEAPSPTTTATPNATGTSTATPAPSPTPTGAPTQRPTATSTSAPTATAADTASSTAIPTPTATPPVERFVLDVTRQGEVSASSVCGEAEYPERLAVDGDLTTSWFGGGSDADGPESTLKWTGLHQDLITEVIVWSNADHAVPELRTHHGFEGLTLYIYSAEGLLMYEASTSLAGSPDPDVAFHPHVMGQEIVLIFIGHEAPDCAGFAELQVFASR